MKTCSLSGNGFVQFLLLMMALWLAAGPAVAAEGEERFVTVTSLEELQTQAQQDRVHVRMIPGAYRLSDYLTEDRLAALRAEADSASEGKRGTGHLFEFAGNDSVFHLDGVTIEVDTRLLTALGKHYLQVFELNGDRNTIRGLTIRETGDEPTASGGNCFAVMGAGNTLQDVTLLVSGSSPYGYGDLLGKGNGRIVPLRKQSGLRLCGDDTRVLGCTIITRAFGHAFFIQGAKNTYLRDCYAEGVVRTTDAMLAETSGPAFDGGFQMVYRNHRGDNHILPGYMKSLSECGFRTYGTGPGGETVGVTAINCTSKNMRVGFALTNGPVRIENCTAIDNERSFYLADATARNSRGDASFGPLLFLTGNDSDVELTLSPTVQDHTVHAVMAIEGTGHRVELKGAGSDLPVGETPILLGYGMPSAGEGMAPIPEGAAKGVVLINHTTVPVVVGPLAADCTITSVGEVARDEGTGTTVKRMQQPE